MTTGMTRRPGRLASARTNLRTQGAADGRHTDHQRTGPVGSPKADIIDLVFLHHRRIRRVVNVLEATARRGGADGTAHVAGILWSRLAELLDVCAEVEREICFLPLFGASHDSEGQWLQALADQEDIRAAVQEVALQRIGSPAWWRAVSAAAWFTRSHLDTVERGGLAAFAQEATPELRRVLGEQWVRFAAALRRDRSEDSVA